MGKRPRKGPFNAIMDPTEVGAGSALLEVSEAAKNSGTYDVWDASPASGATAKVRLALQFRTLTSIDVVQPKTPNPRSQIAVPAVPAPHEGTSYNPLVTSHQELLRTANEIEERRIKEAKKLEEAKRRMEAARAAAALEMQEGVAPGMTIQPIDDADADTAQDDAEAPPPVKKMPERKTKKERRKAERQRAEKRALAERAAKKRMLASVDSAKALRKALGRNLMARERLRVQRQAEMQERLKQGLTGQRLGKHKVPEGEVNVQLSEDLSESLRALKVSLVDQVAAGMRY